MREMPLTDIALERFLVGVDCPVTVNTPSTVEAFPANITHEWLVIGVQLPMASKIASLTKTSVAYLALEWFLPGVGSHVVVKTV